MSKSTASDVASLRAEQGSYRIFSVDEAVAYARERGFLALQPLCGGLPPDLAWESLRLVAAPTTSQAWRTFAASIVQLGLLLTGAIFDNLLLG